MSTRKSKDKLSDITDKLALSLGVSGVDAQSSYEFSSSYTGIKVQDVLGKWKIVSHHYNDEPWQEVFARGTFKTTEPPELHYEAIYEFMNGVCIKKVLLSTLLPSEEAPLLWEYRMTTVLSWELQGSVLSVHPLIGYQYTSLDGTPSAVRELPADATCTPLEVSIEAGLLYLKDTTDIKILESIEE